jgi:SagB-type dehydrogenase family enzyme
VNLEAFLHDLHFDVDKVRPPDWIPDWSDAPLPYKLYRGLPTVPLPASVPLTLEAPPVVPATPDLTHIGHLLWYVYGIHRLSQTSLSLEAAASGTGPAYVQRRFLPSGGALYPNELYVYLRLPEVPWGIYHYDAAHHRLVLLREGRFDPYLRRTLADRIDVSACFATVFVSTVFWKGFFKYADFAYRLQAVDSGVAVGQVLEVARRFGYTAGVCFQFLDRAVNHLLGLSDADESVYAVVPLSVHPVVRWVRNPGEAPEEGVSDADLNLVTSLGLRGYRIQQMQAGIMLHRLLLVAAAMGWNGHPLLGFEAPLCDDLYDLPARGQTALVQVPIGPHRPGPRWEGGLHG